MDAQEVRWEHYPCVATNDAARAFIERLVLKGKQPKTVDAYARAIDDLLKYFSTHTQQHLLEAEEADLDSYIEHLKQCHPKKRGRGGTEEDAYPGETNLRSLSVRGLSENTIAQRIVACRLFYDFLIAKRLRHDPINPIMRGSQGQDGRRPVAGPLRRHKRLPWVPSDEAWESFVRHVIVHEDSRTCAMILLAYDAALRREELMLLRADDIDWAKGVLTIRPETSKGGRMRFVPVSAGVLSLLREYLEGDRCALIAAYDGDDTGLIFLSESTRNPGRPLAVGAFDEIVERIRKRVGLPALTPHTLRHQRCTILKRAGVTLDDIALFAGHKSTETTRLYIHLAPSELSKRIRAKAEPFDAPIRQLVEQRQNQEPYHDQ